MSVPGLLVLFALGGCAVGRQGGEGEAVEVPPSTAPPLEENAPVVDKRVSEEGVEGGASSDADDPTELSRTITSRRTAILTCTTAALRRNPKLSGQFAATWVVTAGTVTAATLTKNTTGDDALGACALEVIRATRYDPSVTATVDEWKWVVEGE